MAAALGNISGWTNRSTQHNLGELRVKAGFQSISFACSRTHPSGKDQSKVYIDNDLYDIFLNAVIGKAHENMQPNYEGECTQGDKSHCGNRRGELAECRCPELNRTEKPHIRYLYENNVINAVLSHPKVIQAKTLQQPFEFNITMFCSGRLLGEEILLFRLFDKLREEGLQGIINICLIDRDEYRGLIALNDVNQALDSHLYLNQFLQEITKCLPPSLKVSGTIFAEASHYINAVNTQTTPKHDLLIGADMEEGRDFMGTIQLEAGASDSKDPIALVGFIHKRGKSPPGICTVDQSSALKNCYLPLSPIPPRSPPSRYAPLTHLVQNDLSITTKWLITVGLIGIVVAIIFASFLARRR